MCISCLNVRPIITIFSPDYMGVKIVRGLEKSLKGNSTVVTDFLKKDSRTVQGIQRTIANSRALFDTQRVPRVFKEEKDR